MNTLLDNIYWTISSIPRNTLLAFLAILLLTLFLLLIFCLCQAAKMGDDLETDDDAQQAWLAEQHKEKRP